MQLLKEEIIKVISRMPESVDIDEVMYQLYVIDKIRKGRDASGDLRDEGTCGTSIKK